MCGLLFVLQLEEENSTLEEKMKERDNDVKSLNENIKQLKQGRLNLI